MVKIIWLQWMSLFGHNVQMTFLQLSPSQLSRLFLVNLRPPQCLAKPPKWAYEFYLFWFLTKLRIDDFLCIHRAPDESLLQSPKIIRNCRNLYFLNFYCWWWQLWTEKNIANQPRQKKNSNVGGLLKGQQDWMYIVNLNANNEK